MSPYSKGTWLWIGFVITAMLLVIGMIEVRLPAGRLSTGLMLGVVLLGYASIFVWLYRHRIPSKPQKQPRSFHLARRDGAMIIYESSALNKSLDAYLATQKGLDDSYN